MTGSLSVLNVGAGDIEVVFNQHDHGELARAIAMLKDMAARGYAILVRLEDGSYTRARHIDPERGRYIITLPQDRKALPPSSEVLDEDLSIKQIGGEVLATDQPRVLCKCGCGGAVSTGKTWILGHHRRKPGKARRASVPIHRVHATGVARSAGG
jgi:hypothetical protein